VAIFLAVLAGLAFGAGDQYLGSMSWLGPWAATAAQVSAPWLILPFLAGMSQERSRRAVLLGSVATVAALVGYFAMTYSPMEVPGWTIHRFATGVVAVATSGYNPAYILGGIATGPIFGLLGQRWRVRRWWVSAALASGALCLEPAVRLLTGQLPYAGHRVWWIEVGFGTLAAALFAVAIVSSQRATARVHAETG
jgi:hypothetical protein